MTTESEQALHDSRVTRAEEIIRDLLINRHLSARDALVEICGTEEVAELLAEVEGGGLYADALDKAVWEKVKREIIEPTEKIEIVMKSVDTDDEV